MKAMSRLFALALSLALSIGAAVTPTGAQQRRDGAVILIGQEPAELFAGFGGNLAVESDVQGALYCTLVTRNEKWELQPVLAQKIPSLKDGDWKILPGKKMQVTFKLRPGWKWHDGRPITAQDFVWSLRMRKNPRTPVVSRYLDDKIDNVLAPDPLTVIYQFNELFPYADTSTDLFFYPAHVLQREYNRDPTKLDQSPFARAPIHCGPYRFKQWQPGSLIELEAFDGWAGEKQKLRTITYRMILDSTVMTANIIGNQGDATATNNLSLEQMDQIARRAPGWEAHYTEGLIWEHIDFNLDNEWLKDKRVRQAIAHAFDREGLTRSLFGGRQPVAHTFLGPKHFAHNANVKKYNFDANRARALFAEAGWTPGPDGVLRNRAGQRFEVTIMTTAGNALREQVQQIMRDQLRQVGIDLRIDNRPASVFFGQITRQRTYPHLAMYAWLSQPTSHFDSIWRSRDIPTAQNNFVGQNIPGYRNADVDRLIDQASEELDPAKRRDLLLKVQEAWAEDLPSLPLYFRLDLNTSRKALLNFKPRGISPSTPWNVQTWSLTQQ
jgi:peptide/nickel transport system substrate-binding protein